MMRILGVLIVAGLLSGCTGGQMKPDPKPGVHLDDFMGCPVGPDGQSIDCDAELETAVQKTPPPAWLCVAHLAKPFLDGMVDTSLWTDSQGHLGLWLQTE